MNNLLAGVLGYAGVLFQSRGGSASESPFASDAGEATSPIRGAHILWAGKRVSSGRLELGFSPAWLAKNPRLADIQYVFVLSVMPYAEEWKSHADR